MEDPESAASQPATADPTSFQAAMEVPITVWLGPMGPLLRKLHSLMAPGHNLPDLISEDEIRLLKGLCISLKNMSEDEDASSMARCRWWMKVVRELCYDTEDHVDEICGAGVDHDFSELLARANDASESLQWIEWSPKTSKPADQGEAGVRSQMSRSSKLGVVEPPKKLVELLAVDDGVKTLKVIPLNGCAGVGKTTVARTLYHKHGGKFQCRAFVIVSRNPDMRAFLNSMLSQLKAPPSHGFPDVSNLIDDIRKHLQGKRYFIVIDDLWTASVWNTISRAFPRGDHCSRIITTTRINDVALACCSYHSDYIYKMEPLNDHDSRKLFFNRVFGSEDGCLPDIKEVSYETIRKCAGFPLAILNIAGLLASEPNILREKWKHIQDSLPSACDGMKDVVNLTYNSLPPRLRTCLLYFSMYPQGYVIKKEELVKQWVSECFLGVVDGRDTQEIAEGYFDELVSRGMVQAMDTDDNGEVLSCTVHQMLLDFIRYKSMEENFAINVDYFQSTLALPDKVRRLSVQFGGVKSAYIPESIVTSQVRSLIFWGFFKCVPSITDYGLLRVLILHIWADQDKMIFDLTMIEELFRLKYLKIECNMTVKLPGKIQNLQHLGTMDVDARIFAVPPDIVNLESLLHLRLPSESILPNGIAQMASLHSLGYFDLNGNSEENVLHLGQLTNLQDLQLTCSAVHPGGAENLKKNVQLLGSILEKLSGLRSVTLVPASGSSCASSISIPYDGINMLSPPPDLLLRRIELSWRCCIFFSLPRWFGELRKLCILKIALKELSREDIDVLKGLPSLTALTLHIQTAPAERIVINNEGFQVLTYFKFVCPAPCMSFVQGAMPKVEKLSLGFNANNMEPNTLEDAGFPCMTCLSEISVKFGAPSEEEFDIKAAESALEAALSNHPSTLIIRVQCVHVIFYGEKDKSTKEKEDTTTKKLHDKTREGKRENTEISKGESSGTALEKQHEIEADREESTECSEEESTVKEEIEDTAFEKQHEIEEDKEKSTKCSEEESTTDREKNTKSSVQVDSRYAKEDGISPLVKYHAESVVTGAMGSLIPKLTYLLQQSEHLFVPQIMNKHLAVETEKVIHFLRKEMVGMHDALSKSTMVPLNQMMNIEYDVWSKQARDLSYVAEDIVDSFLVRAEASGPNSGLEGIMGLVWRATGFLGRMNACAQFLTALNHIIPLVQYVATRNKYTHSISPNLIDKSPSPLVWSRYDYSNKLVGTEVITDEVIGKLTRGIDMSKKLNIISILGMAGLGKTTLAKALYDRLKAQYDCRAFVSVSRRPIMRKIFMELLSQIDKKKFMNYINTATSYDSLPIEELQGLLANKRYFIVIDDIWSVESWERIKSVLYLDCNYGGTVIITTQVLEVARKAGQVYMLKPLSIEHSRELLSTTLFGGEGKGGGLPREAADILRYCGGLPLAITIVAKLLCGKTKDEWSEVSHFLGDGYQHDEGVVDLRNIWKILVLSYYSLPHYLRNCLMHLRMYPQGHTIKKETLIWKWIAEGFIPEVTETRLFENGERCFSELVSRSLIMPIEDKRRGIIIGCHVNYLVHDFICLRLIAEKDFSTILDNQQLHNSSQYKARRLAIQKTDAELSVRLGETPVRQVRSFNATMCHLGATPSLARFEVLRVLAIEECTFRKGHPYHLDHIGGLIHLRYLGLYNTHIYELPAEIGHLRFLQTLDLRGTGVKELPHSVCHLSQLKCLRADDVSTRVPDWIGELKSLEELRLGSIGKSVKFVKELGKLTELRELEFKIEKLDVNSNKALVDSIWNLKEIGVLGLVSGEPGEEANWDGFVHCIQRLRDLRMKIASSRMPAWINPSVVPYLSRLSVEVKVVERQDLENLGRLPKLISLELLTTLDVFPSITGYGLFPKLRYFATPAPVNFLRGAMSCLESFCFRVHAPAWTAADFDFGTLGYLPSLEEVEVEIISRGAPDGLYVEEMHEALKHAVQSHPNSPKLDVIKTDQVEITC